MGSSVYLLLILLLAMTSTVTSQQELNTTKEIANSFVQGFEQRSSGSGKCAQGQACQPDCASREAIIKDLKARFGPYEELKEAINKDLEAAWSAKKSEFNGQCASKNCEIVKVTGYSYPICGSGSVKMQITGYLFALTIMVIFLPALLCFFGSLGPESGLPMEQCCGKEKETPKESEPEGTPKPSCGEWTTAPAEAPVAVM